jgi:hypothetical protein
MENFVRCIVVFLRNFLAKIPMLKWINQGGGGYLEWRVKNG